MERKQIETLSRQLNSLMKTLDEEAVEFWYAREIQTVLEYAKWENFRKVIEKAMVACRNAGVNVPDHFLEVRKKVLLGSGAERQIDDFALTRYACYLIAQNSDPQKKPVAFAQSYFALQTHKQELLEKRVIETERLMARRKLCTSEKQLSDLIHSQVGESGSFAFIRSMGDNALFGGNATSQMKSRLGVPASRPLADFLPAITIKAKDFANEITSFSIRRDQLDRADSIGREHVKSNEAVREVLLDRGIVPEDLPAAEDVRKLERRLAAEDRKLKDELLRLPATLGNEPGAGAPTKDEPAEDKPV